MAGSSLSWSKTQKMWRREKKGMIKSFFYNMPSGLGASLYYFFSSKWVFSFSLLYYLGMYQSTIVTWDFGE